MDFRKLEYSVSDGIAFINLNSPKNLNSFDEVLEDDLIHALDLCDKSEEVKVVVLSGKGNGFSAGGDVKDFYRQLNSENFDLTGMIQKIGKVSLGIKKLKKPVISSVFGPVAGAGFNVAISCDFCIAAENSLFIQAFVGIGLIPDAGGVYLLNRTIGVAKATELIMLGKPIKAEKAYEYGLVNKVVSLEKLNEETMKLAKKLANGPSFAYAAMKDLTFESEFKDFEKYLEKEVYYQTESSKTEDFREGVSAFVEKRKPVFQGK